MGRGEETLADRVLGQFSQEEKGIIEKVALRAVDVLELWIAEGIAMAMQAANSLKT